MQIYLLISHNIKLRIFFFKPGSIFVIHSSNFILILLYVLILFAYIGFSTFTNVYWVLYSVFLKYCCNYSSTIKTVLWKIQELTRNCHTSSGNAHFTATLMFWVVSLGINFVDNVRCKWGVLVCISNFCVNNAFYHF